MTDAAALSSDLTQLDLTKPDSIKPDLIQRYLDHLKFERQLSSHTLSNYQRDLLRLAGFTAEHAKVALDQLEDHHIRRFAGKLHAQGLSARSIARSLSAWRTFYQWLMLRQECDANVKANPVADIRAPKPGKRLPKALSPDLAVELVSQTSLKNEDDALLALRDAAMFELFYSSGLRLSEVVGLDQHYVKDGEYKSSGWIDFEAGEITVTGKGNKQRTVPVGAPALTALQAWLNVRDQFIKSSKKKKPKEGEQYALFLSERGTRLSGRSIELRLKAHAIRLGMPAKVHPHMLRHSFASHVLQSSGDLRAVQEMLGHASIAATQVYTSLDFQRLAKVYDEAHPRAKKR